MFQKRKRLSGPEKLAIVKRYLPDRKLEKLRTKERRRIAQLLDQRQSPVMVAASGNGLISESVGDQVTSIPG